MTHGSLFSGIGGFDIAAQWAGWENVFACEIDPFCQKVLKYHFPKSTLYENIRTTDFTIWRGRIDVLSGGFPCQPFSTAGKRKGTEDDRYLWPEMLRAIREISPRWVVGENVLGIVNWNGGMVFEQVCADLEAEGYEVQPYVLPACGVGAPHQRQRTWFVAHSSDVRGTSIDAYFCPNMREPGKDAGEGFEERIQKRDKVRKFNQSDNLRGNTTDTQCVRRGKICQNIQSEQPNGKRTNSTCCEWDVANSESLLLQGYENRQRQVKSRRSDNEQIFNWQNFPTQSPVCGRDDGIPGELDGITLPSWRRESLKAYGNAVVPLVPLQIFNAINQYEKTI